MANIPGINTRIRPGVVVRQTVRTNTVSLAGGPRTALIIGEGLGEEILISQARGGGLDGVNADYSGVNNPDGRHFQISKLDLVPNRSVLLKNGIPLNVIEQPISVDGFDSRFDARLDPETGRVQLQGAKLVDFGGTAATPQFYKKFASNVGTGKLVLTSAGLLEQNAPSETWVVRCAEIVLDGSGNPVPGQAVFTATGSVSGSVRDLNGNQIRWKSNGVAVSNGILNFAITEGGTAFKVNDKFSVQVASGVLSLGDRLEARYIAYSDLNVPETFFDPAALFAKHGQPSTDNTLSLGASLAYENGAASVIAVQAMPPIPRKTSEILMQADNPLSVLEEGASGDTDMEDCVFSLAINKVPDVDTNINIFVIDPNGDETQVTLNKVPFFNAAFGTSLPAVYANFSNGSFVNSYTVVSLPEVEQNGDDGYLYSADGYTFFTAPTVAFAGTNTDPGEGDFDKTIVVFNSNNATFGNYEILEIGDGFGDTTIAKVAFVSGGGSTAQSGSSLRWHLVDNNDESSQFCLSADVVGNYLTQGKGLRIAYTDAGDSEFFDTNWLLAYEAAESADAQLIVPLPKQTISNVFGAGKAHVISQSSLENANERLLLIGAINGLIPANLIGTADAAVEDIGILEGIQGDEPEEILNNLTEDLANYSISDAFGDTSRVIYMAPDQIIRNIAGTNTVLDGFYAAAAMAGFLSAKVNTAEPATNKTLTGFTIPRNRSYRPTIVNQLIDAGACLLEPVGTGGRIVHGITTAQSGAPEDEEISIVEIRDLVVKILRNSLRPFIGRINAPTLIQEISAAVDKIMRALVTQGLLTGYAGLTVGRDIDATQVNVGVRAFPAGPLNTIFADIEFTLGG